MKIPKPTDAELEILQVLWEYGANTVRFVNEHLNEKKETGYTTTLKLMQIMHGKEMLSRDDSNRTHIFDAAVKEEDIQKELLDKFLDATFRGSASKLVMHALGNSQTSKEELDQIRQLLDQLEGGK
ncbi:BlaI/MecI/CopY family transcriptional regulator [Solitalea sp. MAHUQ-68]|uniref:BlaI/MecI/CopY family transcriptional regulator n=1 Tax=Solitalea agri TaxID=2953739 RepID=A0A9X2F093_9SPHI|nr:BlaI/MecI/CopY family transcriptional regulator [Solitalea agri]MCO4291739.1 BlaI/MecI/CopY family transcriptional regulator [Solitalea agri]